MNAMVDYVPMDRRHALANGHALPDRAIGAALFTDISGFTPTTEALARMLGPQRGAEELLALLNDIYQALMAEVDRFGGSVISFADDALSVWFDSAIASNLAQAGLCALACAFSMQAAMAPFGAVTIAGGPELVVNHNDYDG
jgi:class 3 adenylate cyclase